MQFFGLKQLVFGASVFGALFAGTGANSQKSAVSIVAAQTVSKSQPNADSGKVSKAARRAARAKAADASLSARNVARREPKSMLKGITMTKTEKRATGWIAEKFLDKSEELDKADKNAYWTPTDTSTLIADIKALRMEQRAALRAALTPANRIQFDTNVALLAAKGGI